MPHSEQGLCIPNNSDISLNDKANPFKWAFLHEPLAIQFISRERNAVYRKIQSGNPKCILFPESSNVTHWLYCDKVRGP